MSIWYDIKKTDEVNVSEDGKTLDILFDSKDYNGATYVQVPLERVKEVLKEYDEKNKTLLEGEKR